MMFAFRFRGIYLAVMAIPLFLSVTLLLFLRVDLLTRDVSASEISHSASYVSHVLKMQQALDSINVDLNLASDKLLGLTATERSFPLDNCKQLRTIKMLPKSSRERTNNPVSRGPGIYGVREVQVVRSNVKNCQHDKSTEGICLILANYQILKEAVTFLQLSHPALARILGICSSIDQDDAMYITETGLPFNITHVKTFNFTSRLQIIYHVISLIGHLQNSSLGPLSLRSVDNNTFVWINGMVKLADISQLINDNTACKKHSDCLLEASNAGVKCHNGVCSGLQSQISLRKTMTLLKPLFAEKHRNTEHDRMQHILSQIDHLNIDANEAARQIKELCDSLTIKLKEKRPSSRRNNEPNLDLDNWQDKDTLYWPGGPDEYKFERRKDMNIVGGQYDYMCPRSLISWGCQLHVNTVTQALTRCTGDPQCRAFVLSRNEHQIGTLAVVLKSGVGEMRIKEGSMVYVKIPLGQDNLHLSHDDDLHVSYQNDDPTTCANGISISWKKDQEQRHTAMMKLLHLQGLTEAEWLESVKSDRITSFSVLQDDTTQHSPGMRMRIEIDGVGKSAILNSGGKLSSSLFSHLLFYHLDRLLGLHRVVPSAFRSLETQEQQMISNLQPKLRKSLLNALQGNTTLQVVMTPDIESLSLSTKTLTLKPLSEPPAETEVLTQNEKSQLEYLLLLWLSGTPRDQTYTSINCKV